MINLIILITTIIVSLTGIIFSIWSFINTRKKFYSEFIERKMKVKND